MVDCLCILSRKNVSFPDDDISNFLGLVYDGIGEFRLSNTKKSTKFSMENLGNQTHAKRFEMRIQKYKAGSSIGIGLIELRRKSELKEWFMILWGSMSRKIKQVSLTNIIFELKSCYAIIYYHSVV